VRARARVFVDHPTQLRNIGPPKRSRRANCQPRHRHHDPGSTLREYGHVLAGAQAKVAAGLDVARPRARVLAAEAPKHLRLVPKSGWTAKVLALENENPTP
jgi:hypothetical protein